MRTRITRSTLRFAQEITDLPASPPAHVLRAVDRAAERAEELWDDGRQLHFELDPDGRVVIQMRDLDGRVLRAITPSEALDVLSDSSPAQAPRPSPPLRPWTPS
jgi:hypothetical protein